MCPLCQLLIGIVPWNETELVVSNFIYTFFLLLLILPLESIWALDLSCFKAKEGFDPSQSRRGLAHNFGFPEATGASDSNQILSQDRCVELIAAKMLKQKCHQVSVAWAVIYLLQWRSRVTSLTVKKKNGCVGAVQTETHLSKYGLKWPPKGGFSPFCKNLRSCLLWFPDYQRAVRLQSVPSRVLNNRPV